MRSTPPVREPSPDVAAPTRETPPLVILREGELDCDLQTAIGRVRANEGTAKSRILVIGPDTHESEPSEEDRPLGLAQAGRRGEVAALQPFGSRMLSFLTCLDRFLEETDWALRDLEEAVLEQPRARLLNQVKVLEEIQAWSVAVAADMRGEARSAAEGFRWVDAVALWREAGQELEDELAGVRVTVVSASGAVPIQGRTAELAEAFLLALRLAASRVGDKGSINVELALDGKVSVHRIQAIGEPRAIRAPADVTRLRHLLATVHRAEIAPDALGPHGTGISLRIPQRR